MQLEINLNSSPFSVNSAYYKNRQRTQKCRQWGINIHNQILHNEALIADMSAFRTKVESAIDTTCLSVNITFFVPDTKLFTKSGKVSRRSMDLSNVEKLLIDLIFDKRYYERDDIPTLCLDDTLITKLTSKKVASWDNEPHIRIVIKCHNHKDFL